jgi:hypothetical protein
MKKRIVIALAATYVVSVTFGSVPAQAQDMPKQYQGVLETLGKKGDYKENVLKVNIPRTDLTVTVDGVATPTPFGFGGWLAMTKGEGARDVMMGDLVLLEDEVNPVMSALLDNGLEVTALHNHSGLLRRAAHLFHACNGSCKPWGSGAEGEACH